MPNFVNARVPKYAAINLFLRVSAYTLRLNRISQLRDKDNGVPQRDKNVRRKQEKCAHDHLEVERDDAPGWEVMSAQNSQLSSMRTPDGPLTQSVNKFGRTKQKSKRFAVGRGNFLSQTDPGILGASQNVNLPEPEGGENGSVLSIV